MSQQGADADSTPAPGLKYVLLFLFPFEQVRRISFIRSLRMFLTEEGYKNVVIFYYFMFFASFHFLRNSIFINHTNLVQTIQINSNNMSVVHTSTMLKTAVKPQRPTSGSPQVLVQDDPP